MELNPAHPIIREMVAKGDVDKSDKTLKDLIWLMYESSLLTSGFSLEDPNQVALFLNLWFLPKTSFSLPDVCTA